MHSGMFFGWMWIFWILVIAAIGWLALLAFRAAGRGGNDRSESPEQVLKRRYARGEISKDDYEQRLADIRR